MPTIPQLFLDRVHASPDVPALAWIEDNQLRWLTWTELANAVLSRTLAMKQSGIQPDDLIAHLGANGIEWVVNDLAIQFCGGVHVPFHALSTSKQIRQLLQHCRPKAMIFADQPQLQKTRSAFSEQEILTFGNCGMSDIEVDCTFYDPKIQNVPTDCLSALKQLFAESKVDEQKLISILYTSGTTGQSKGVMLSQENVVCNVDSKLATLHLDENDIRLCVLPMTHIFARVCDIYTWIQSGSRLVISNGKDHVLEELELVQPTYLNAVPYYYEKFWRHLRDSNRLDQPNALSSLLGGRIRIANCGGAAIADHVFDYYWQNNIQLILGYGLTETSPVLTSSRPGGVRRGSVGQVVPGVEIRLADDREILARGKNVMQGYFQNPDLTSETIRNGWIHTGDIGEIDEDGFLFIVGRKKELIVTKGGKNISPVYLESLLNEDPLIAQSMVVGDQQDFLTALIVIDQENYKTLHANTNVEQNQVIEQSIRERLDEESPAEQVRGFLILEEPFSIENGMMTAKSSLRRQQIFERYSVALNELYQSMRASRQG